MSLGKFCEMKQNTHLKDKFRKKKDYEPQSQFWGLGDDQNGHAKAANCGEDHEAIILGFPYPQTRDYEAFQYKEIQKEWMNPTCKNSCTFSTLPLGKSHV